MTMKKIYHVKKRTLLSVAGCVWLIAGFNVARLGVLSYGKLLKITAVHIIIKIKLINAKTMFFMQDLATYATCALVENVIVKVIHNMHH